jgi:ATP-dependent protease Clp ATPase subunit
MHIEVLRFIAGPGGIYICNECIDRSHARAHESAEKEEDVATVCSFCGKAQTDVLRLIGGPGGVHICNECLDLTYAIVHENAKTIDEVNAVYERLKAAKESQS